MAALSLGLLPGAAGAHNEREAFFPAGHGVTGQPQYRPLFDTHGQATPQSPRLVVCKKPGKEGIAAGEDSGSHINRIQNAALRSVNRQLLSECRFEHIQAAVDAVTQRGTTIYILPGVYREQPSIRALEELAGAANPADATFCQAVLARGAKLTYAEQVKCPHIQNTIAIFGDPNPQDDNCGSNIEGVCTHPETQKCDPAASQCQYYDLQMEGTGERVTDVVLEGTFKDKPGDPADGHYTHINGIRGDRTDGLYLRNFTAQIYEFNAVYVMEADGYVYDHVLTRWNQEYGFLSFASDHGLYTDDEGYGNADSALYPGAPSNVYEGCSHGACPSAVNGGQPPDLRSRQATELRNSKGHHNTVGYSGTAGNAPWLHGNDFFKNMTGILTDSIVPGHPGMPQDHALWENNRVYNNNMPYYQYIATNGPCNTKPPRDRGLVPEDLRGFDDLPQELQDAFLDRMVVCSTTNFPTATGIMIAGGNYDVVQNNQVFDNWRRGVFLLHVPATLRNNNDPTKQHDTSHFNRFLNNRMAENTLTTPARRQPNGVDFWYSDSGTGNCWDGNSSAPDAVTVDTINPLGLPGAPCADGPPPDIATQTATSNDVRIAQFASCTTFDPNDPGTLDRARAAGCDFFDVPPAPANRQGSTTAIATRPTQAQASAGETVAAGYFVLNNDTGKVHTLGSATVTAEGPTQFLSGLQLAVITASPSGSITTTVTLDQVGGTNVFTFSPAVNLPAINNVAFELQATASGGATAKRGAGGVILASGAGSAMIGIVLLVGVGRRRDAWLLILFALCASLLVSCGSSEPVGGGSGAGGTTGKVMFTLTALSVQSDAGAVSYSGLPLSMGSLELH